MQVGSLEVGSFTALGILPNSPPPLTATLSPSHWLRRRIGPSFVSRARPPREGSNRIELLKKKNWVQLKSIPHVRSASAEKLTRQWAAWTRQEEQSFFNALRQEGKNFEKITLRVQSKNKDQVRHYYYRLV